MTSKYGTTAFQFNNLMELCGLSNRGAAHLLGVRYDTIKNWKYGKCKVPAGVMRDLRAYANAADKIFKQDKEK